MIKLTEDQTRKIVEVITAANESVRGTCDYWKYWMSAEYLSVRTNHFTGNTYSYWHFIGNSIPSYVKKDGSVMIYKKVKDNEYLYYGDERYLLEDAVKDLIKDIIK